MSGLEIFLGITLGLIVNETCDLSPWAARRLVRWSAHLRYTDLKRAETRASELISLIEERPGKLFKLTTACGFLAISLMIASHQKINSKLLKKITLFRSIRIENQTKATLKRLQNTESPTKLLEKILIMRSKGKLSLVKFNQADIEVRLKDSNTLLTLPIDMKHVDNS